MAMARPIDQHISRILPCCNCFGEGLSSKTRALSRSFFHSSPREAATYRRFGQPIGPQSQRSTSPLQRYLPLSQGSGGGRSYFRNNKNGQYYFYIAIGGGGIYYVVHLERVPSTGRLRFIDVTPAQERELGQQTFQQTMQEVRHKILPSHDPRVKHVRAIAERILEAARRSEHPSDHLTMGFEQDGGIKTGHLDTPTDSSDWEVFVIQDPNQANAFVLANGKIFVFSGILPICKDTDGLATVLGHEVAHKLLRHPAEKFSGYKVILFGVFALQLLGFDYGISSILLKLVMDLPNSRKTEVEADKIGLQLMSMACFDPSKAPSLWQRMKAREGHEGNALTAVLSTHPLSSAREKSLQEWLPQAMETRRQSGCPESAIIGAFQSASRPNSSFQSFT